MAPSDTAMEVAVRAAGTPMTMDRYQRRLTRHFSIRPTHRRSPALPSAIAVTRNAAVMGPR